MIFSLFTEFNQPTPLTFSSPAKMFFSPAQEAGFSVKNILGGEENASVAKHFLLRTKCQAGAATQRGKCGENKYIFVRGLVASLDLAGSDIIWTILYTEKDGLGQNLIETILQDRPMARSGPPPGFLVFFEVFR